MRTYDICKKYFVILGTLENNKSSQGAFDAMDRNYFNMYQIHSNTFQQILFIIS